MSSHKSSTYQEKLTALYMLKNIQTAFILIIEFLKRINN